MIYAAVLKTIYIRLEKAVSRQDEVYGVTSGRYLMLADTVLALVESSMTQADIRRSRFARNTSAMFSHPDIARKFNRYRNYSKTLKDNRITTKLTTSSNHGIGSKEIVEEE